MDLQPVDTHKQKTMIAFAALLAVVIIAGALVFSQGKSSDQKTASTTTPSSSQSNTTDSNASYKDGVYDADASYPTPGGTETISVHLTVASNQVSDVSINQSSNNHESQDYQQRFADAYKQRVVGKKLSTLNVSVFSGASLTIDGFNDAVGKIRQQAAQS